MQTRTLVGSTLLIAGMLLAGCGGAAPVEEPQPETASREDALPDCTGKYYETEFYSNDTYTTVVGGRGCMCSSNSYYTWGSYSRYSLTYTYDICG